MTATAVVEALWRAHAGGPPVAAPTGALPGLEETRAYALQEALVERLVADGAHPVGWKVGMASAVGREPSTPGPIYGRLLADMRVADGDTVAASGLRGLHAEGEIAFVMAAALRGPGIGVGDVLAAAAGVQPAIELYASRLESGASAVPNMRLTGLVLRRGEAIVGTGAGAQVLGHPAASVAWLANALAERGQEVSAGDVVITGAIAGAHRADPGDRFVAEVDHLGRAEVGIA
jgi:2-keto-4-pentenoate hydratase